MSDNPTYYMKNKEALDLYTTKYYKEHNIKIKCNLCDCMVLKYYMPEHKRSQKHMKHVDEAMTHNDTIQQTIILRQTLLKMKAMIIQQRAVIRQQDMPPPYTEHITL